MLTFIFFSEEIDSSVKERSYFAVGIYYFFDFPFYLCLKLYKQPKDFYLDQFIESLKSNTGFLILIILLHFVILGIVSYISNYTDWCEHTL